MKIKLFSWLVIAGMLMGTFAPAGFAQRQQGKGSSTAPAELPHGNVEAITEAQLKDYLYFVASDMMEGRDTPSRGLDMTARFIAMNLSRWGIKPIHETGDHLERYFQKIDMHRSKVEAEKTRVEFNGQPLKFGEDYLAQLVPGSVSGTLVYAGHGWVFPAKSINPYQGVEVKDKIVILSQGAGRGGLPRGVSFNDLRSGKEGIDFETPVSYLKKHGAKAIAYIPSPQITSGWKQYMQRTVTQGSPWMVTKFQEEGQALPSIVLSEKSVAAIFQGEQRDGSAMLKSVTSDEAIPAFDLSASKKLTINVSVKLEKTQTQNVVGILEGGDPRLKDEYLAIGAHYDHVGIGNQSSGDAIYNGADDDGSGTVAVLAIAEAMAKGPRPKRSILFVWHAGEEKGLWGSRYITDYPIVPNEKIIAQLNIDMIGRGKEQGDTNPQNRDLSGPNEIYVIGSKMMSTELGALSEEVNKSYLNLLFNYKYDDPKDPNRFFFRSDHFNYARKGIPIIFYFDGVHEDYHKVSDHPDKINYRKLERVTRTILATGWALANRATRPVVDKQLPAELSGN